MSIWLQFYLKMIVCGSLICLTILEFKEKLAVVVGWVLFGGWGDLIDLDTREVSEDNLNGLRVKQDYYWKHSTGIRITAEKFEIREIKHSWS